MQDAFELFEEAMNHSQDEKLVLGYLVMMGVQTTEQPTLAANIISVMDDCAAEAHDAYLGMMSVPPFRGNVTMDCSAFEALVTGAWLQSWKSRLTALQSQDEEATMTIVWLFGVLACSSNYPSSVLKDMKKDLSKELDLQAMSCPRLVPLIDKLRPYLK